jgi:RNA polymerase sigma-70 factor (ECF subfamily)
MVENGEDARDLTQEVFIQLYQSLPRFRSESSFGTWAYRIAVNKCLDFLRRKKTRGKEVVLSLYEGDALPGNCREGPEEAAIRQDESRRLKTAIKNLPQDYRIVLVLHHYQQLSYKEIAEILSIPVKTVATRLYRAKLILKEKLAGGDPGALQKGQGQSGQLHGQGI